MISRTTKNFRQLLAELPPSVRRQAREVYQRWSADPWQHGLQFKRVHTRDPIWSVRISRDWRALCVRSGEDAIWFWIGSHADYDSVLARL